MTKKFIMHVYLTDADKDLDHVTKVKVEFDYCWNNRQECCEVSDITVSNGSEQLDFDKLPKSTRDGIELECDRLAYNLSSEAEQDWREAQADAAYDRWKDRDYEE